MKKSDSANQEFERIEGELEAAIVFAAAAEHEYQNRRPEFSSICLSDAEDAYIHILRTLSTVNLAGAHLQHIKTDLVRLRRLLDGLRNKLVLRCRAPPVVNGTIWASMLLDPPDFQQRQAPAPTLCSYRVRKNAMRAFLSSKLNANPN